ncbi:hypothetical protein [Halosimplex pelagicum]|uniref:Uncharacterized protein n=1 Tax=Halosimplex pelagicum TaxID=869886 RepID=A0A7D5TVP1_9EURY|nr:hypothetical protein [Halosimplex pelagicum]QLH83394.1 hypothetical protein HZS54_17925 [Halosimplex pelagicum]
MAPVLWLVWGDPTGLPDLALALALGPLAAPLAVAEVLAFPWWVWYVVGIAWVGDMAYFGYFDDVATSTVSSWSSSARRRLSSRWSRSRRAGVAVDGGQLVLSTDLPSLDRLEDARAAVTVRRVAGAVVRAYLLVGYSFAVVVVGALVRGLVLEAGTLSVDSLSTWVAWAIGYLWPLALLFAAVLAITTNNGGTQE